MSTNQEWTRGSSHCPESDLNLSIKTENVTAGVDATVCSPFVFLLSYSLECRIYSVDQAQKPDIYQLLLLLP